jgi:hypothetical protein
MGLHFVNMALVADPALDPRKPEIVTYEPKPNETPQIMGQLLHLFESPNRFGLPDFYTLHLWAWKDNPTGAFVHWHANVYFNGQAP